MLAARLLRPSVCLAVRLSVGLCVAATSAVLGRFNVNRAKDERTFKSLQTFRTFRKIQKVRFHNCIQFANQRVATMPIMICGALPASLCSSAHLPALLWALPWHWLMKPFKCRSSRSSRSLPVIRQKAQLQKIYWNFIYLHKISKGKKLSKNLLKVHKKEATCVKKNGRREKVKSTTTTKLDVEQLSQEKDKWRATFALQWSYRWMLCVWNLSKNE